MGYSKEEWNAYMREWRKTDAYKKQTQSAKWKWGVWKNNLKQRYNVTPEWVGEKFIEQQGKCAICRSDIYYNVWGERQDKTFSLHIDHNHRTGIPRGLLCQNCNVALGKLQESVSITENAHRYLIEHLLDEYDEQ